MAKPFRVIHGHVFGPGVTEKAKCRKRVVESSENPCFPNIPLSIYGPSPRNPGNIHINLLFPETGVIGLSSSLKV